MIYIRIPRKSLTYCHNLWYARPLARNITLVLFLLALCLYSSYGPIGVRMRPILSFDRAFRLHELQQIWEWEVKSGHYPSSRKIPDKFTLDGPLLNPGIPKGDLHSSKSHTSMVGVGLPRKYLDMKNLTTDTKYPPRPKSGSIADLDIIMDHCDFSSNKYVRDCLQFLSFGAGFNDDRELSHDMTSDLRYIYVEEDPQVTVSIPFTTPHSLDGQPTSLRALSPFPPLRPYLTSSQLALTCDPEHPRIFHVFWGGPFTSHPYSMILSFLYTQNLGLHLPSDLPDRRECRPELWVWIHTGPAQEANPTPDASELMHRELKANPWSAPFLHVRFKDIIKFKLWNTTEQLDSIQELKDSWRSFNLFTSGGIGFYAAPEKKKNRLSGWLSSKKLSRMVLPPSQPHDHLRTILSDLARFVLCHRFGGIYLDADTLLLRDWQELWGWKGAFAYRWSRTPRYNTAVLKLNKGSALGSFLINSALFNGLDFHPADGITKYIKETGLENLLLRLPDALFDPAWLNAESFQRDRPPPPDIRTFSEFFEVPAQLPGIRGATVEGFFRGAYSYHWHNNWNLLFDATQNWPELGPRFADAEQMGRLKALRSLSHTELEDFSPRGELDWKRNITDGNPGLAWSALIKRTFEAYIRGERPNMYGEWLHW